MTRIYSAISSLGWAPLAALLWAPIAAVMVASPGVVQAQSAKKRTLAVLDFEGKSGAYRLAAPVTELMMTGMSDLGAYRVVERRRLRELTKEIEKGMLGLVSPESAKEVGKLIGADYLMMGSVTKLGRTIVVSARLVDVETGEAVFANQTQSKSEDQLPSKLRALARFFNDSKPGPDGQKGTAVDSEAFHRVADVAAAATLAQLNRAIPDLRGRVKSAWGDEGEIAIGKRHGVLGGQRFEIWGDGMLEGKVRKGMFIVGKVLDSSAKGRFIEVKNDMVEDGDEVRPAISRVAIGKVDDEDAKDAKVAEAFTEKLRRQLGGGKRVTLARGPEVGAAVTTANGDLRTSFPKLRKAGIDLYVEGRMYGAPGARIVDLQVWNVYSEEILTKLKVHTDM